MASADDPSGTGGTFVPALIVVDMQEDFCPPNGSLAVQEGRTIAPLINRLLSQPEFVTRVATQDYHPLNHISFASNHPAPNNLPFESFIEMRNPAPAMIPEIDLGRIDQIVRKGRHAQVEMYSAFADAFGNLDAALNAQSVDVDLASYLKAQDVTDVFVVGLAGDYCVKCTAIDAVKAGFRSWLIEEGTKCVVPAGWAATKEKLKAAGVSIIHADDPVVKRLSAA